METNIFQRINELILLINQKIVEGLSDGILRYDKRIIRKLTVNNFNYDTNGYITGNYTTQDILKNIGFKHEDTKQIKESVLKSKEYVNALDCLNTTYGSFNNLGRLDTLISRIIGLIEDNSTLNQSKIDFLTKTFIKELNNEPVKYGAIVELEGIIMMIDKINITEGVILRRPNAKDIEGEFFYPFFNDTMIKPSAILNIEFLGKDISELQRYVLKVVALLRLFKKGAVENIRIKTYSDSILDIVAHGEGSSFRKLIFEKYSLSNKDETNLIEFWNKLFNILPDGFHEFRPSKTDYLTIAFKRYSDSLLNDIPEKRVANAVMGLEALFLNGEGELKYRLSKRTAKLMGLLGYNAIKIDQTVIEAYNIRSKFVHGDHLKADKIVDLEKIFRGEKKRKGKKRLDILDNDENMNDFIRKVIEILRVSIMLIMLQRNGESDTAKDKMKNEFIELVDDSLIDKEKEKKLEKLLLNYKILFN